MKTSKNKDIKLILGTMTFGEQLFGQDVADIINCFLSYGYREVDTAFVYNEGKCEKILGSALADIDRTKYSIASKVNPRISGRLDEKAVIEQCNRSLERLDCDYLDILYLHFPDPNTPIESALRACARLYEEGKFRELGLSNFPAWLVAESFNICKTNNWVLPTVYQGLYNPLSRHAERELNEALNYYGIRFYAYNPLAGGLLTNKYSSPDQNIKSGRFKNRPNYQDRYWKESYFEAVDLIRKNCYEHNISVVEATYRWLAFHSMLNSERGDGIIVGASKLSHIKENIESVFKGPLPETFVETFDKAWEISYPDAPEYFRYYKAK